LTAQPALKEHLYVLCLPKLEDCPALDIEEIVHNFMAQYLQSKFLL
jgi:hypothetical protein